MHEQFNRCLVQEARAGRRFIVVIDEAQNLDASVLETVRLLSDFETPQAKLMQIILVGQPALADKLASPALTQLRQRITSVSGLNPLTPQETARFIGHRLQVAGYKGARLVLAGCSGVDCGSQRRHSAADQQLLLSFAFPGLCHTKPNGRPRSRARSHQRFGYHPVHDRSRGAAYDLEDYVRNGFECRSASASSRVSSTRVSSTRVPSTRVSSRGRKRAPAGTGRAKRCGRRFESGGRGATYAGRITVAAHLAERVGTS